MLTLGGAGGCCGAFMNLLIDTDYAPWLVGFALNIGMGLILVIAYNAVRSALPPNSHWLTAAVIGVLFGGSALISMNFPVRTAGGLSIDARNVFILTGSLFGGPVAAIVGGAIAIAYRLWLGGPGAVGGAVSIVVTAAMGALIARRYGKRVEDLRGHELFLIGLTNSVAITAAVEGTLALQGYGPMPTGALVGAFIIFPLGAVLLGSAMGMTHHRIWWRTQRRLDDIVETVSDLVWETDAMEHVTFLSERTTKSSASIPGPQSARASRRSTRNGSTRKPLAPMQPPVTRVFPFRVICCASRDPTAWSRPCR